MQLENELRVFGCKVHALAGIHLQLQPVALGRPRVMARSARSLGLRGCGLYAGPVEGVGGT